MKKWTMKDRILLHAALMICEHCKAQKDCRKCIFNARDTCLFSDWRSPRDYDWVIDRIENDWRES